MDTSPVVIDAFQVDQEIGSFFVGCAKASSLLRICKFDFRRMSYDNGYLEFLGLQRQVDKKRANEIARFAVTRDACFPSAIVLSIPEKCVDIEIICDSNVRRLSIHEYVDSEQPELSVQLDEVASIIDGQHRLRGLEESLVPDTVVPVSVFVGADDATEASIFSTVNLTQTKVNRSLVYDLFAVSRARSPEKTCHEIAVALDEISTSPFNGRIKRLGTATPGRFKETLSQATIVGGLLPYITRDALADRDRGKRFGFWEPLEGPENSRRIFFEFFRRNQDESILKIMMNYFTAVANRWPEAWQNTGTGGMLSRTNGYNALMRFLRPAYLHFTAGEQVVSQAQFEELFSRVELSDSDFSPQTFLPGTSGAAQLYQRLIIDTGIVARLR